MRGRSTSDDSTSRWSRGDWWGVVLEAPDARSLARFYSELLGWEIDKESPESVAIAPSDGVAYIAFQTAAEYVRPVWPAAEGAQRITMQLDFEVTDLPAAVTHAVELGAQKQTTSLRRTSGCSLIQSDRYRHSAPPVRRRDIPIG